MTKEAWRAAVTRWGDPIFGLALLLTDQRPSAETSTIATFRRVFTAPPPTDPETALYTALVHSYQPPRWQLPQRWSRRSLLPRALRRIAPQDRLLLGLWLLRGVSGPQLATILDRPSAQIVARLAALLRQVAPGLDERRSDSQPQGLADRPAHVTLERWLEHQLVLSSAQAEHTRVCPDCRAAQGHWHAALDQLRTLLVEATRGQHLAQSGVELLEESIAGDGLAEEPVWWQQRRIWLPALLGGVALLLAALIVPRGSSGSAQTAAPPDAQALVRETLAAWGSPPAQATLHQRVQALNLQLRTEDPVVTEVWLDSASPAHRVEVRRGKELIEWQLAEGATRFTYGGWPSSNSCRWNTGYSGDFERFDDATLAFRITPEAQQAVRDARLRQGAYGAGYGILQQALDAPDLRSFGTRVEGGVALTVLSFTDDRSSPPQQMLLRIDPDARQLYAVQQVMAAGGQTQARDLWRLQAQDTPASGVPNSLPAWKPTRQIDELIDPACPALKPDYMVSLRQLTALPYDWYMLQRLPPGAAAAAIFSRRTALNTQSIQPYDSNGSLDMVYVGAGRWLSMTSIPSAARRDGEGVITRGPWSIQLTYQQATNLWHGFLQLSASPPNDGPTLELSAYGWSRDQLLEAVDLLKPFDVQLWGELDQSFVDPQPLSAEAKAALLGAAQAVALAPEQMAYNATQVTVRTGPQHAGPADPFFLPDSARQPARLNREQWFVATAGGSPRVRDVWSLPDGTIYVAETNDSERIGIYALPEGKLWTGATKDIPLPFQQADMQLLQPLLGTSRPARYTEQGNVVLIEQLLPNLDQDDLYGLYTSFLIPRPRIEDLPGGEGVLRLWLDRSSLLPQRLDLFHRTLQGQETPLSSMVVVERRLLEQPQPGDERLAMPVLPDDTLTLNIVPDRAPVISDDLSDISWTRHSLSWPQSTGLSIVGEQPPSAPTLPLSDLNADGSSWYALNPEQFWRQTRYKRADASATITLTQGPRRLMRHVLRYMASMQDTPWTSSERIAVTIDGVAREAWLLRSENHSALVVEVDDLMLHIAADEPTLRDVVLAHISELRPRQASN